MIELLKQFKSQDLAMFATLGTFLIAALVALIAIIIGVVWVKVRRANIEGALKVDMLNRGMSAEEIRTVVEAGSRSAVIAKVIGALSQVACTDENRELQLEAIRALERCGIDAARAKSELKTIAGSQSGAAAREAAKILAGIKAE